MRRPAALVGDIPTGDDGEHHEKKTRRLRFEPESAYQPCVGTQQDEDRWPCPEGRQIRVPWTRCHRCHMAQRALAAE